MKKTTLANTKKFFAIVLCLILSNIAFAQNVTVSGALAGNGSYPDLNSAFAAINGGAQTNATITVDLVGNTTETVSAVLNSGAWTSLMIQPSGGSARTITGAIAGHLIDLNGADNVSINGLNTGGNALTISNTNTGAVSTIRFIAAASNNAVINCTVLGSSTDITTGTILFSTATAGGNSNNMISTCDVGPAGTNLPANGIISIGTASNDNANNTIQNCNVFDFFSATIVTNGILVGANNTAWTISGNRIYQTGLRTYTTGNTHQGIRVTSGNNHNITNNRVGYASNTATGNYAMTGTIATRFIAIDLAVATTSASSVQGNTVTAITLTTSSGAATANGIICGINVTSGNVNIGSISGNIIGGTSGTNLITGNPSTTGGLIVGINSSSTGTINIRNNYIGGFFSSGSTAAVAGGVAGIINSGVSSMLTVANNTIGNPTPNNMVGGTLGLTTGGSLLYGIWLASSPTGTINIHNNLIQNGASFGVGTSGVSRGIYTGSTAGSGTYSVTNNTIINLTTDNGNTSQGNGQLGNVGIAITNGASNVISGNVIGNLSNTNTLSTSVNQGGISVAVASNGTIFNNTIYGLSNTGVSTSTTAPSQVYGIFIRGGTGTLTVNNNMISLGSGQTANTAFSGVVLYGGGGTIGLRMYYNTINITGSVTAGNQSSFCFYRGGYNGFATTWSVDLRNNIFNNDRTGGTGFHCAIANNYASTANATGWAVNASNYNVLNASTNTAVAWYNAPVSFANWKTTMSCDANSYSGIAVNYVNSANDLHLNMGTTPTFIESGGQAIAGFTTDIDGQVRPGPAGSVNGGGFAPDIGADEVDAAFLDAAPPIITHTVLPGTCSTSDRTLSANIVDFSGTNTGTLTPRIYYTKNGGSYVNASGVLASGTPSNGTWNFTISSTALSGVTFSDVISYYIIAQDGAPVNNVISSPSVGLVASDVNNVTTPPSSTYSYVIATLNGTYTIGSTGSFTSITQAATRYNNSCLTGPITYVLTDANYSTSETFPVTFSNNIYASATNSLLIIPASANNVTITGASNSILGFIGADYIKLDGSNNGTSSRNITLENLTSTLSTVAYIGNSSLTDAASNITINNCVITGSTGPTTTGGIILGSGMVLGGASEISNNNMVIRGNHFMKTQNAVFAIGNATTPDLNWDISNNLCGSTLDAEKLGFRGIAVQNASLFTISSNTVLGIKNAVTANNLCGILVGAAVSSGTVTHNVLSAINNTNTTSTSGATGIALSSSVLNNNILVANNMISNVTGYGGTGTGITNNGHGVVLTAGGGYKIYHNTVWLNTEQGNTALTSIPAALFITSGVTAAGAIDLRNNIFVNTQTVTTNRYALYSGQTNNAIFSNIDNNIYSTTGPNLGFISSARADLAAIQAGFGGNLNSSTLAPVFTSTNDLHLNPTSNNAIDDLGTPVGITIDIDNQSRSNTLPDIGADEFTGTGCTAVNAGTASVASYTICEGQSVTTNAIGGSAGSGIVQKWRSSTTSGGPYTDVSTGTGFTTPYFNTGTLTAGTNYYVLTTTCTTASLTAASNEVTVTVLSFPTPSISTSHTLSCQGNSVTLTASGANSYTWSAVSNTNTSIQVVPTANTTYSLTGDVGGCKTTTTIQILYSANPTITASSASTFVCLNANQATLSATGANTYTWTDGTNNFIGPNVNPTPTTSTTYSVIGTNTNGCNSAEVTQSISVNAPAVSISGNIAICPGETTTLTATGTSLTYSWSTGATTSSITSTPASNTVYIVTGTDGQGCQRTFSQAISVGNVSVSITGPSTVCTGNQINLTASGATSYTWDTGAQVSTIAPSPTVTTTYSVIGVSGNCSNTAVRTITVNPFPVLTVSGNSVICAGQTSTLTVSGASTYSWNTSSTATAINVSPTTNTVYSVDGNSLGCITNATFAVTSNSLPIVTVAQSATAVCVSSPVSFTASGANTYSWSGGPSTDTFVANPTSASIYTVTGTTAQNCSATRTVGVGSFSLPVMAIAPASATTCIGGSVSFTASGAATYTWNASPTETTSTFSNTPTANITHTVVGTTSQGCVGNATVALVANPLPTLSIAPASITLCVQSPATFNASGADTYTWNSVSQGSTANFFHLNNTTHTVVGTNSLGCSSNATVGVTTLALPVVSIAPSLTTVCVNSTANFTASGAITYTWYNASTNSVIAITPSITGSYSVVGTDANGCSSGGSAVILTNPLPIVSASINTPSVCPSRTVGLSASGASTYSWITLGAGASIVNSPSVSTTYTVVGTSTAGCSSSANVSVFVFALPSLTVTPASPTLCLNQTTTLTASGANSYTWSNATSGNTLEVTSTSNETFTLTGVNAQGCINSKTVPVVVNQLPNLTVLPGLSNVICSGETTTLTVSGASTFTWMPSNVTTSTLEVSATSATFYTVEGTDANNCKNQAIVALAVNACTGIDEVSSSSASLINVYPNPSNGSFNIEAFGKTQVVVYNLLGAVVYENEVLEGTTNVNIQHNAKGVYYMKVSVGKQQHTYKLIVE